MKSYIEKKYYEDDEANESDIMEISDLNGAIEKLVEKSIEDQRRAADEKAKRSHNGLVAKMSHDLTSDVRMLKTALDDPKNEVLVQKAKEVADGIQESLKRFKSDQNWEEVQLKNEDMSEWLRELIEAYRFKLDRLNSKAKISFSSTVKNSVHLMIDKDQLQKVICNIIDNAVDAVSEQPEERRKVHVLLDETENEIQLKVQDSGIGIPKKHLHQIFFPYFTYGKKNGQGLGLWGAKEIVTCHNGDLTVESNDQGTTFLMTWRKEINSKETIEAKMVSRS